MGAWIMTGGLDGGNAMATRWFNGMSLWGFASLESVPGRHNEAWNFASGQSFSFQQPPLLLLVNMKHVNVNVPSNVVCTTLTFATDADA